MEQIYLVIAMSKSDLFWLSKQTQYNMYFLLVYFYIIVFFLFNDNINMIFLFVSGMNIFLLEFVSSEI